MAWSIVPEPGTKVGPCEGDCQHTDCAATRKLAATICRYCRKEIGFGGKYTTEDGEPVHFLCLVEAVEKEAEADTSGHSYEVTAEGATMMALHGKDGTRLVGVHAIEAWARDAIQYTADALNAGEITETEAHAWCTAKYKELRESALDAYYGG